VFSIHPRRWLSHPLTPAMLWVALLIVFFSIPEGKRIDYLAPTYPVAAILAAYGLVVVLRRYGVTPVRVAVASIVLVIAFTDYQWRRSPEAVGREGEYLKSFARDVKKVAGDDRIVFTALGFHPLQTLLGRHQTDPVTFGDLAGPGWAIMPVADVTTVRPLVISNEIPQVKVVANAVTQIHERRSGRLGLYRLPLMPGPATTRDDDGAGDDDAAQDAMTVPTVIPRAAVATRGISGAGATLHPEIPQVATAPFGMT